MIVFVLIQDHPWEGYGEPDGVFDSKGAAEKYAEENKAHGNYEIHEFELNVGGCNERTSAT